jgi:lysophospholipase L1-like esterase
MHLWRSLSTTLVAALLYIAAGCSSPAPKPLEPIPEGNKWAKELRAFEASDATQPPPSQPIVFTGSSSIRLWKDLTTDFAGYPVINRGFGGSELSDVNQFFERLIGQYQPKQIVIYCGGNDLNSGKSVEQVVADFKTFHARVRAELPETQLAYISIALNPARWAQRDRVIGANAAIAAVLAEDPRSVFLNVVPDMLGPDGQPKPDIFVADKLHMNRKGYELWKPRVEAVLVK